MLIYLTHLSPVCSSSSAWEKSIAIFFPCLLDLALFVNWLCFVNSSLLLRWWCTWLCSLCEWWWAPWSASWPCPWWLWWWWWCPPSLLSPGSKFELVNPRRSHSSLQSWKFIKFNSLQFSRSYYGDIVWSIIFNQSSFETFLIDSNNWQLQRLQYVKKF